MSIVQACWIPALWPGGKLIAETSQTADLPDLCPASVSNRYIQEGSTSAEQSNLDLLEWLLSYQK
jgi:hypothetical protein